MRVNHPELSSDKNIPEAKPIGIASTRDPKVIKTVPTIKGKIPNEGGFLVGAHSEPKKKEKGLIFKRGGIPLIRMKNEIISTLIIAKQALRKMILSKIFSI